MCIGWNSIHGFDLNRTYRAKLIPTFFDSLGHQQHAASEVHNECRSSTRRCLFSSRSKRPQPTSRFDVVSKLSITKGNAFAQVESRTMEKTAAGRLSPVAEILSPTGTLF